MCGITGFTHRHEARVAERIALATDVLRHRGPDQSDTHYSERIALGAVRLKIIDLQGGDQPFFSDDLNTVLVFNGEIYNHAEIRAELETLGHEFISRCDTEVVLRAFLQWDTNCFARFRGMFALALWNEPKRRLILARDRVGIKPLYVHRRQDDIFFASELKSLFAHEEIPRELDHSALSYYLALNYVPGPFTLVKGIEKLAPGSWLEWNNGRVRTESFWNLSFQKDPRWTLETASLALDDLMKSSVREHMISDVPVGIWLSGGVDSSAVLHYTRQSTSSRISTFSIGFAGRSFDESGPAREIAKRYGAQHFELDLNPSLDLEDAIHNIVYYSDEPFADAGAVPLWFLSKLSRESVTVALSGEGSDELFGGYVTYRADRLAQSAKRIPELARRSLLKFLRYWPVSNDKISFEYKMKRFLEGSLLPSDEAHTYWNGSFSHAQQAALLSCPRENSVRDLFNDQIPCRCHGYLTRYLAFDQRYYLTDDLLQKVDRMSMAHSLEVRPPYLDHRIIEFAASLPDNLKIDGRRQKVILKHLMKNKLPDFILNRSKTGLDIPTHDWFRGPLRPLLEETLNPQTVEDTGLFRPGAIQQLISDHREGRANLGFHLWGLLILFLWIKQWKIQTTSIPSAEETQASLVSRPA
ncbi:MAG: asparagine synthase (glutamine-hydrolyzing) [Acidobacteria bacterium]|nr:asparagine synthase (glutamine-hydrolyzing) [Acidobacteriota bacterium]MBS1864575.1 asparagine synthase (glutamine-hydrolyzing) [Acidobacteriota bacterium]